MAHNFRILDGDVYVSKAGHDSNDGFTPDAPKRGVISSANTKIVIGAGMYDFPLYDGNFVGDGTVKIKDVIFNNGSTIYRSTENIHIENVHINRNQGEFGRCYVARNCVFSNCTGQLLTVRGNDVPFDNTHNIFVNCQEDFSLAGGKQKTTNYSILINSNFLTARLVNSYVDRTSLIDISTTSGGTSISHSNIQGKLFLNGENFTDGISRTFAVNDGFSGTPQDNGYEAGVIWFTVENLQSEGFNKTMFSRIDTLLNKEPLFNNPATGDFTVQAGSPHIGGSEDGITNIGGTKLAVSVINSSNGIGNLEVIPSPEIDISNVNSYKLKPGHVEGYIDYIHKIGSSPLTLGVISPISVLNFDSDFEGGSLENNNVPDSEPSTSDYPRRFTTTANAVDSQTLEISGHNIKIGEFVRVNGEDREVISTTNTNVRVASVFRAPIVSGTVVQIGSETDLSALKPNRLTYQLRTSKKETKPVFLSDWDNDTDPLYGMAGKFLTQEWDTIPGYVIDLDTNTLFGAGDSTAPRGLALNEISCRWVNLRVFIRNNYSN